jgi:propanol-preferring alcohol dehydrogenase
VVDGELPNPKLPIVPGHEIVAIVETVGRLVSSVAPGDRVGIPWLGSTCGECPYCKSGRENLCDHPEFTGYTKDGGFATHVVANAGFCFQLPAGVDPVTTAPWLCAGLIGWRSFRATGDSYRIGFYGFGAAAHLLTQVCVWQGRLIYAFTRPRDFKAQAMARELGAVWAGSSDENPPQELDAAIIFAPVGALVPIALRHIRKGGRVVCGGIHMSDIPQFPYSSLWGERQVSSVANLTRGDAREFLKIAPQAHIKSITHVYALDQANQALDDLRAGRFQGAAVIVP